MSRVILQEHIGYAQNGRAAALSPATGKQIQLYYAQAMNRSGGAVDCGIVRRLNTTDWAIYKIIAADTPDATDVTSTVQAGSAQAIFTLVNNDGFMVGSKKKFNIIGLNISTAASGGAPVYEYTYYNGTSMATLTTTTSGTYSGTGVTLVVFNAPHDWVVGTASGVGGDSGLYHIRVRSTTASGTAGGSINDAWVGKFLVFQPSLADKSTIEYKRESNEPLVLDANEGIFPYFSGTANALNSIRIDYKIQD